MDGRGGERIGEERRTLRMRSIVWRETGNGREREATGKGKRKGNDRERNGERKGKERNIGRQRETERRNRTGKCNK